MASLALSNGDLFSVVTTADRGAKAPLWKSMLNWPSFGDAHVPYAADTMSQRNVWAARLDDAVLHAEKPVLLLASGAACFATAWWARLSPASYVSRVAGALLFAPLNRRSWDSPDTPEKFASPKIALPFPSAIISRHALRGEPDDRLLALAESWGSRFVESGLDRIGTDEPSAWQQAQGLVMRLTARVVERDLRVAETFGLILGSRRD